MFSDYEKQLWKEIIQDGEILTHSTYIMDNGKVNDQYIVKYGKEIYHITYWDNELVFALREIGGMK